MHEGTRFPNNIILSKAVSGMPWTTLATKITNKHLLVSVQCSRVFVSNFHDR